MRCFCSLLDPGEARVGSAQLARHEPVHGIDHDHVGLAAKHGEGIEQGDRPE